MDVSAGRASSDNENFGPISRVSRRCSSATFCTPLAVARTRNLRQVEERNHFRRQRTKTVAQLFCKAIDLFDRLRRCDSLVERDLLAAPFTYSLE